MRCVGCGSAAVTRRPERTARGYCRFRCRHCHRQFNERSTGQLNRTRDRTKSYPDFYEVPPNRIDLGSPSSFLTSICS
jgi:transposase-like protein